MTFKSSNYLIDEEHGLPFEEDLVLIKTVPKQFNPDQKAVL